VTIRLTPSNAVHEEGVERRTMGPGERREDRVEFRDIGAAEAGAGAHAGDEDPDVAAVELGQDRVEVGAGNRGIKGAQHVVGTKFDDDQVGLARQAVEGPAEPRLAARGGVARNPAVGDGRGDAVAAQACLELGHETEPGREVVSRGQAVPKGEDKRFG
jgi:hypothetical protein